MTAAPQRSFEVAAGEPVLKVRDLEVRFETSAGPVRAVDGVSFDLRPGERLGLVGESGSGKSTTVLALLRMIRPPGRIAGGAVTLGGEDVLALAPEALRRIRFSRMSLIPQGAMSSLNPVLTVGDQIGDLLAAHGVRLSGAALRQRMTDLLARVGLGAEVVRLFPHQLSGGMKQRVCIALAIALRPQVIVADEPTSALDVVVQKQVLTTLGAVQADIGAAVILIGHDMGLMAQFAHRIGVMYAGRLVEIGPVRDIFATPAHPYTRMLISSLPSLVRRGVFKGIPGVAPSLLDPPPGCPFHVRCPAAVDLCRRDRPALRDVGTGRQAACHLAEAAP
ncbi:ABC transporter ATP-binding protein [Prosthecomicrobium sp. N25]|uniref:ABC transporter ATP-binding protein n=1 Tax=Prosthecomicrobium sp. N25 TaxID=3129254 RepID=UPI0030788CE8